MVYVRMPVEACIGGGAGNGSGDLKMRISNAKNVAAALVCVSYTRK